METGRLNQRIMIQKKSVIFDGIGDNSEKWTDFFSCWAEVRGVSGREYWQARQANEEKTITFKIRFCEKIRNLNSTDYRIFFRNTNYNIHSVDNELFRDRFICIRAVSEYERSAGNE